MELDMESLYFSILQNIQDGVYYVDNDRHILFWNKAAEELTGYTADEIVGKTCQTSNLNHIDQEGRPICQLGCPLFATCIDGKQRRDNVFVRHKDGYRIPITVNIFPITRDGKITGSVEVFTPNSPVQYEDCMVEHLSDIAMHDNMTKLPNRQYLESFLDYKLSEFKRFGKKFVVVFADIDHFSNFNNTYGHEAGDTVLINVAKSILNFVGKNDMVGRWGGEEFVGIFDIHSDYEAPIRAEKLRVAFEGSDISYDNMVLNVTASLGVTIVRPGDTKESIVKRADALMYQSKENGRNRITSD